MPPRRRPRTPRPLLWRCSLALPASGDCGTEIDDRRTRGFVFVVVVVGISVAVGIIFCAEVAPHSLARLSLASHAVMATCAGAAAALRRFAENFAGLSN